MESKRERLLKKKVTMFVLMLAASMVMIMALGASTAFAWDWYDDDDDVWISGLYPANGSTISTSGTTITATFEYDPNGDEVWGWSMTLDGVPLTCSRIHGPGPYDHLSCPVTNLIGGSHQYTAAFWGVYYDELGDNITWFNAKTVSFNVSASVDTTPPVLTLPSNITVQASDPLGTAVTYSASAADAVYGPVDVTCVPPSGSTFPVGTTTVNCSAADNSGNTASGSFTVTVNYICESGQPSLSLSSDAFWASYSDYFTGLLSVSYTISNNGTKDAYSLSMLGSNPSHGVTVESTFPIPLGDIAVGSSQNVTLAYTVPAGVGSFQTTSVAVVSDECGASYGINT